MKINLFHFDHDIMIVKKRIEFLISEIKLYSESKIKSEFSVVHVREMALSLVGLH